MEHIHYQQELKYRLVEDYSIQTDIKGYDIQTEYITLCPDGLLTIKKGYPWDGCSGPTHDDKTNMRAGLVHDAHYQLMREGRIPLLCRTLADNLLKKLCLEDGMCKLRAWYYFEGVDHFALYAATKGTNPYPIITAP